MNRQDSYNRYYDGQEHEHRMGYGQDHRSYRDMQQSFERDYHGNNRHARDHYSRDYSNNRGNYDNRFQGDYRQHDNDSNRGYTNNSWRTEDRFSGSQASTGDIRQGYGISSYDGTSDRYNTLGSDQRAGNMQEDQPYYSGNRDGFRSSRYGGGMGDAFPNSNRGIPNYSTRNFADNYGTGMGSTYGGKNYGGGTGYASGHRGGSFGNENFGTSAGNYGGYGSMGSSTYGGGRSSFGRDSTSHNSNRGASELGGF